MVKTNTRGFLHSNIEYLHGTPCQRKCLGFKKLTWAQRKNGQIFERQIHGGLVNNLVLVNNFIFVLTTREGTSSGL